MSTTLVTLIVSIAGTQQALAAGAPAFGGVNVSVTDAAGNTQEQTVAAASASGTSLSDLTFSGVAAGAGSVVVQAVDASGNDLGTAVTQAYNTTPPVNNFFQPTTVTVSLGP